MARKLRVDFEGAIHHVTVRGIERRRLFRDDEDRNRFLLRLKEAVEEYGVRLYLFCMMENHVHLVLETPGANLSAFMRKLQTAYAVYFNLRHGRSGHLMQGRFWSQLVSGDEYLLRLSRYVHLNPVVVGHADCLPVEERRRMLRHYRWSSYRGYVGLTTSLECVAEEPLLRLVGGEGARARLRYRRFVEAALATEDQEFRDELKAARWAVGNAEFQQRIQAEYNRQVASVRRMEDVALRRVRAAVAPEIVLRRVAGEYGIRPEALRQRQYGVRARAVAAYLLLRHAGMNQREIAEFLGMRTGVAVCLQLKRLRTRMGGDAQLAEQINRLANCSLSEQRKKI